MALLRVEGGKATSWHLSGSLGSRSPCFPSSFSKRKFRPWLRALGTYSAAFVDGLWFSAALFVGSLAVQSLGCVSLRPRGLQHTRPPCPSLSPAAPFPAFIVCRLFDGGHSHWCEVVSHCSFDLHFSKNEWWCASFHVLVSHPYVFFGEMSLRVPFPLFDWVVCFSGN